MFGLFGRGKPSSDNAPARIALETQPDVIYAIGDIHGCLDKLKRLETLILEDAAGIAGEKLLITLGDYVDRGPSSAQTLNWLSRPLPPDFRRITLRGNHEEMFLNAIANPRTATGWLRMGGRETLLSYGIDGDAFQGMSAKSQAQVMQGLIPSEHVDFIKNCAIMATVGSWVFVHAGIRPGVALDQQKDEDLTWIRDPFLTKDHGQNVRVVHGHTPVDEPTITSWHIGIDTGAYAGGPLTAIRILRSGEVSFINSSM
jgi:serine/threonine protein phosphatase 1